MFAKRYVATIYAVCTVGGAAARRRHACHVTIRDIYQQNHGTFATNEHADDGAA